jgi:hypothetical protein
LFWSILLRYELSMPRKRDLVDTLRAAAVWLLAAAVLVGPLGSATSSAWAGDNGCGVSCPCDEAQPSQHPAEASHGELCRGGCDPEHRDEAPTKDECPEDCPDCSSGAGIALGIVAIVAPAIRAPSSSQQALRQPESRASGTALGVFRPPRPGS